MFIQFATLAQLVEHLTCNEDVVGSIPTGGSIFVPNDFWFLSKNSL